MKLVKKRSHKFIDLTGLQFGRLRVLHFIESNKNGTRWMCECSCSKRKIILGQSLTRGMTKSCGCIVKEKCFLNTNYGKYESGIGSLNALYLRYKYSVSYRRKKLIFDLSIEDFARLTSSPCFYCKTEPFQIYMPKGSNGSYLYNGLDRIDSEKHYTADNVVPCCKICNRAKNDMSQKDFFDWLLKISNIYGSGF